MNFGVSANGMVTVVAGMVCAEAAWEHIWNWNNGARICNTKNTYVSVWYQMAGKEHRWRYHDTTHFLACDALILWCLTPLNAMVVTPLDNWMRHQSLPRSDTMACVPFPPFSITSYSTKLGSYPQLWRIWLLTFVGWDPIIHLNVTYELIGHNSKIVLYDVLLHP
jgi:hypothetical protein